MKWLFVAVVSLSSSMSDLLQCAAMKEHGPVHDPGGSPLGRALRRILCNWKLFASLACMTVSFFAFLALVSVAELSFAVPATAISFALETVLAHFLLKERVDWRRYLGATLVSGGVMLLLF